MTQKSEDPLNKFWEWIKKEKTFFTNLIIIVFLCFFAYFWTTGQNIGNVRNQEEFYRFKSTAYQNMLEGYMSSLYQKDPVNYNNLANEMNRLSAIAMLYGKPHPADNLSLRSYRIFVVKSETDASKNNEDSSKSDTTNP